MKLHNLLLVTSSLLVVKTLVEAPNVLAQTVDNAAGTTPPRNQSDDESEPDVQPNVAQPEVSHSASDLSVLEIMPAGSAPTQQTNRSDTVPTKDNKVPRLAHSESVVSTLAQSMVTGEPPAAQPQPETDEPDAIRPSVAQPETMRSLPHPSQPPTLQPQTNSALPRSQAAGEPELDRPNRVEPAATNQVLGTLARSPGQGAEPSPPQPSAQNPGITPQPTPQVLQPEQINLPWNRPADEREPEVPTPRIIPEENPEYINPPRIVPGNPDYITPSQAEPETPDYVAPPEAIPSEDSEYIRPPQVVPDEALHPFTTAIPLNGDLVTHLTDWEFEGGYTTGEDRSDNISVDGTYQLHSEVQQSLSRDNVFTSDQRGSYFQVQTVRVGREVELSQHDPQTMLGVIIQESFTGPCLGEAAEADPNAQCTYTPTLSTDRNSINEQFLPTRIDQPGYLGDPVSPETLEIIAQPGFQNQGANGETIGVDLYFPNIGTTPGNSQGDRASISRHEDIDTSVLVGYSRVRQILRANDREAVLGRTIRGQGLVWDDDNLLANTAVSIASELLPDANPQLEGSENPVDTGINRNLFRAANNVWTPANSWTIYHAGIGRATHAQTLDDGSETRPNARFNGVWIGLSPVTERNSSSEVRFDAVGPEEVIAATGGEGGANDNITFSSNANGSLIDSTDLRAFYAQVYLTFLRRDVDLVVTNRFTEDTTYYPHISFTGDVTNTNQIFRYYGGLITSDPIKAYLGADFTRSTDSWTFNVGGIGYLNPDHDYFSHVQGSVARQFRLGSRANVSLFTGMRYAFDQTSNPLDDPVENFVSIGARANLGPVSVGLTQYFDNILPNSIETALGVDAALRLGSRGVLRGYYSPSNNQLSYGAIAEYRFGDDYNSPTLSLGWRRDEYDYGTDASDHPLRTEGDTISATLRLGAPASPFTPQRQR